MTDYKTPPLPDRQFFRVTTTTWSLYPLEIQLREKRFFGSRELESSLSENTPEAIHETMQHLISKRTRRLAARQKSTQYCGDYPPKTLEES